MKEHQIIFRPDMAAKVYAGSKTQTRRLNGLEEVNAEPDLSELVGMREGRAYFRHRRDGCGLRIACPYGVPGDRLVVRESFFVQPDLWAQGHGPQPIHYAADGLVGLEDYVRKPSIHMPRWACRSVLDLLEVRVQRVQEISDEDARAEGVESVLDPPGAYRNYILGDGTWEFSARSSFGTLWDSINSKRGFGWGVNPYVWCLTFRRIK